MARIVRGPLKAGALTYVESDDMAVVKAEDCGRPRSLAREIASGVAQQLARGQRPTVFLSGGADSACLAQAFSDALPRSAFRACFVRFADSLNLEEEADARRVAQALDLSLEVLELDPRRHLGSDESTKLAVEGRVRSPQLLIHIIALRESMRRWPDSIPVLAWNAPNIKSRADGSVHIGLPGSLYWCYQRTFVDLQAEGVPFFFAHHSALLRAFIATPRSRWLQSSATEMSYEDKLQIYRESGFTVPFAKRKRTGFEELKAYYSRKSGRDLGEFDRLFRRPLEALCPAPRREVMLVPSSWLALKET
jgi:hypothetical protein